MVHHDSSLLEAITNLLRNMEDHLDLAEQCHRNREEVNREDIHLCQEISQCLQTNSQGLEPHNNSRHTDNNLETFMHQRRRSLACHIKLNNSKDTEDPLGQAPTVHHRLDNSNLLLGRLNNHYLQLRTLSSRHYCSKF